MKMALEEPTVVFDPYKANAYSESVKFDLGPKCQPDTPVTRAADTMPAGEIPTFNPEISMKTTPPKTWEIDVRGLSSTKKWLQNYGLKKNRLDMHHLLPQIGFKHADDFDSALKKPICSRYGIKLFQKYFSADGRTFNLSCSKEQLQQIEARLTQAICLYKRRLEWLTSESRRIFGVIEEKSIAIVLDIRTLSPQQFDQYRSALERVIREEVSQLAKFNLIRASEDVCSYAESSVAVSADSVDAAIEWLWSLDRCAPVSNTATCEAVIKAMDDQNTEAVYLYTEGSACDGARELLKEKLTGARVPIHVVSYNCSNPDSVKFLKNLTKITGGRFHAYAVVMEMDSYEGQPLNPDTNQANILLKKKTYGGVPPGAGVREDVIMLFEELEQARNNLGQIQALIDEYPESTSDEIKPPVLDPTQRCRTETYMSSREWLDQYGLKAKKLGFYDILAGVAFKHQDGVVDLKCAPGHMYQTDAVTKQKLVNARYCDKFSHVRWKDGQVVHVQVTPEIHRNYERRMSLALEAIQQRVDWLHQGSREIFGTVIEDQIYFLVDTSSSMAPHIQFVKDKLFVLMQEQLRHKQKFNLVSFDSRALAWRDRLVDVNEKNLHQAWQWIKLLDCKGSTNTLAALRQALSDPHTQAIYLLTDGRPDQPPKSVLAQVQLHPHVPIHTISFNCDDKDANEFLCQLAKDTGGRFHYYSENGADPDGPEPWESEDIRLLKQEYELGLRNLEKIAALRDECATLAWRKDEISQKCSRDHPLPEQGRDSAVPAMPPRELYRSHDPLERPQSAPGFRFSPVPPSSHTPRPSSAHGLRAHYRPGSARASRTRSPKSRSRSHGVQSLTIDHRPVRPLTAGIPCCHPHRNLAGHTRTSVLRLLSSSGQYDRPEWLLPETQQLFERQWQRQQKVAQAENRKERKRCSRNSRMASSFTMSSKQYLARNGLAAKKLTILDALAPTFIPHKKKYIPIIDKEVSSRVFDDIMPIAHSQREGKKMTIVNPLGVDLDTYQKQVESAINRYKKRLDKLVWDALPEDERDVYGGSGPVSYMENKVALIQALDRCNWPVKETDVILLENEIRQGEAYIQQAKELAEAARGNKRLGHRARSHSSHSGSDSEKEKADEKKDSDDAKSDGGSDKDDEGEKKSEGEGSPREGEATPRSARSDQYEVSVSGEHKWGSDEE